jgi:hypothetical protein
VKGKYKYWEAIGPAQEAYEQISEAIQEVLNSSCGPVRCSSIVNYDIYMVGRTSATAVPHIMFSCKQVESRKQAMAATRKSGVLEQRAPGIDVGQWVCPPHIVNLQLTASNCYSTNIGWVATYNPIDDAVKELFDDPVTIYTPPRYSGSNLEDLSYYPHRDLDSKIQGVWYSTRPIFDPGNPSRTLAMQLIQKKRLDDGSIVQRTATIGSVVEYYGKKFYLAPEHIFSTPQDDGCSATPNLQQTLDDSDCEFGAFSDDWEVTDEEVEFMSQYSLSPAPSDVESDADSSDAEHSEEEADEEYFPMPRYGPIPPGRILHAEGTQDLSSLLEFGSVYKDIQEPLTTSRELDYVLMPADELDASTSHLPIISEGNWARVQADAVAVTAVTGSGRLLQGILSGKPSYLRLPNSMSFQRAHTVRFDGHLLPGDSGSIVRDADTGLIYGHIIAGSPEARIGYIIPTEDVLTHLEAFVGIAQLLNCANDDLRAYSTIPSEPHTNHLVDAHTGQTCPEAVDSQQHPVASVLQYRQGTKAGPGKLAAIYSSLIQNSLDDAGNRHDCRAVLALAPNIESTIKRRNRVLRVSMVGSFFLLLDALDDPGAKSHVTKRGVLENTCRALPTEVGDLQVDVRVSLRPAASAADWRRFLDLMKDALINSESSIGTQISDHADLPHVLYHIWLRIQRLVLRTDQRECEKCHDRHDQERCMREFHPLPHGPCIVDKFG